MTTPATTVSIGGSAVAMPRPVRLVSFDAVKFRGIRQAHFQVRGGALPGLPDPYSGQTLAIAIDTGSGATTRFSGDITGYTPAFEDGLGWVRNYIALSLENRLDWFPHTDSNTLGDTSPYNASRDNQPTAYILSRAGRTVGQILADVLTMSANAAAMTSCGIGGLTLSGSTWSLPSDTAADLAALTLIPPTAVYFGGQQFLGAVRSFLGTWAPNIGDTIDPATGHWRFLDLRAFSATTLTLGSDPIRPTQLRRDAANCSGRVAVRGRAIAELAAFSTDGSEGKNNFLTEAPFAHDGLTVAQAKAAWQPTDYQNPTQASGQATAAATVSGGAVTGLSPGTPGYGYTHGTTYTVGFTGGGGGGAAGHGVGQLDGSVGGYTVTAGGSGYTSAPTVVVPSALGTNSDTGTCTCLDTLTVRIKSTNPALSFGSDYWDYSSGGHEGVIYLSYSLGTDITTFAQRQTVANTAMTPGGTSDVTLDRALPHTNFDGYRLAGQAQGASDVYRRYGLPTWAAAVATQQTTYPAPVAFASNTAVTLTSSAIGMIEWFDPGATIPRQSIAGITVDPATGTILFAYPTYLTAGGVPSNVTAFVPINTGANVATYPADTVTTTGTPPVTTTTPNYAGTSYTQEGFTKTLTITVPSWRDPANATAMAAYASDVLDSVKDTVIEGDVDYLGLWAAALTPGIAVNIAGDGYATGWEAGTIPALPVLEVTVHYAARGLLHATLARCSNRRAAFGSEAFARPDRTGVVLDIGDDANLYEHGANRRGTDDRAGPDEARGDDGPGRGRGDDQGDAQGQGPQARQQQPQGQDRGGGLDPRDFDDQGNVKPPSAGEDD